MGRLCYPTTAPGRVLVPRLGGAIKLSRCKEGMAHFLPSWYKFYCVLVRSRYKFDWSRVPIAIGIIPVTKLLAGTGAVSRYKLSRSQKFITVRKLCCVQMCVSGCNNHYKSILVAGAPACPAYRQAGGRQESKKCDKQLTHIVRVRLS